MLKSTFDRFQDYYAQKYHLFMLDFCYFMNLSVIVQTSLYPDNMPWFKVRYSFIRLFVVIV